MAHRAKVYLCAGIDGQGTVATFNPYCGQKVIGTAFVDLEPGQWAMRRDDPAYRTEMRRRLDRMKARKGLVRWFHGYVPREAAERGMANLRGAT